MKKGDKRTPIAGVVSEDAVFEMISEGQSLNAAAAILGVSESGLRKWADATPERSAKYTHARELRAHSLAENLLKLADEVRAPGATLRPDAARVAMDAYKWAASKMLPRVYGDKTTTELTGKDGGPIRVEQMSDEYLQRVIEGKA